MKSILSAVFAGLIATTGHAQEADPAVPLSLFVPADMKDLSQFKWKKRPVVVFADSADDPAFLEQIDFLAARMDALEERDVVVLIDTDPDARSPIRLKLRPRGFMLVLIGKDGGVKLRKPFPWDVREITRSIDKMPMRQREIRERKDRGGEIID